MIKKKQSVFIGFAVLLIAVIFTIDGCGNTEIASMYHGTYGGC
jgi:hypothetical protein